MEPVAPSDNHGSEWKPSSDSGDHCWEKPFELRKSRRTSGVSGTLMTSQCRGLEWELQGMWVGAALLLPQTTGLTYTGRGVECWGDRERDRDYAFLLGCGIEGFTHAR